MAEPLVSLILSCSSIPAQVKAAIDAIAATQPAERIELLLVAWDGLDYRPLATGFHSVTNVSFPPAVGLNVARVQALERATAPIVVCLEDHVRIDGDWVLALPGIFARERCAAVGWTTLPGARESTVSWAGYLAEYGLWGPGTAEGTAHEHLPGHNTAYDRLALLEYRADLPSLMRAESLLHWRMRADGRTLYFTPRFTMRHSQFHRPAHLLVANFWYGWNFGHARRTARRWGLPLRALYAGAIILKPFVRWRLLLGRPRAAREYPRRILQRTWPMISAAFLVGAVGEAFGYLFTSRRAPARLSHYELGFDRSQA